MGLSQVGLMWGGEAWAVGEHAWDDFAVDRVGDHKTACAVTPRQAEIDDKLAVIRWQVTQRAAGQHRLDDAAHARLAQPFGQAVQVGVLALDQQFFGRSNVPCGDWERLVIEDLFHRSFGEGVDQPGLTLVNSKT